MGKAANGEGFVAVPSVGGLTIYPEASQRGIIAHGAAFIDSGQNLMLVEGPTMQLIDFDGEVRCEWKQYPYHRRTASADGRWIAIADDQKVSVWKMTDLLQSCE